MVDYTSQKDGGFTTYPDRSKQRIYFRATERFTKPITIASGQVLKAFSFLESNAAGKGIAHSGLSESVHVTFTALTAAQTLILGGLTYTDGGSGTSGAQLAAAFANIADGGAGVDPSTGTFSGALTGWYTEDIEGDTDTVIFNAASAATNVTDLAATGTGAAAATLDIEQGAATVAPIAGVLCFDVDASSADVKATAFTRASFWQDALVWAVDPSVDKITLADGVTTVACTPYNTGCFGDSEASHAAKRKLVEGSGFMELGFLSAGEVA